MIKQVTRYRFHNEFMSLRPTNFTLEGLDSLFDYIEELEESTGTPIEFDVIALCCEYTEYEDIEEFQASYGEEYENIGDIENNTTVIRVDDDSFIIQDF